MMPWLYVFACLASLGVGMLIGVTIWGRGWPAQSVDLAHQFARENIESFCSQLLDNGEFADWYDLQTVHPDEQQEVQRCVRFLESIGKLQRHPKLKEQVKVLAL